MDVRKYHLSLRMIEVVERVLLQTPDHSDGEAMGPMGPPPAGAPPAVKTSPVVSDAFEAGLTDALNRVLRDEPTNAEMPSVDERSAEDDA